MVSLLRSEECSEPDSDFHLQLSDTENEEFKEALNSSGDMDESSLLESTDDEAAKEPLQQSSEDMEDFIDAEILVKANFQKVPANEEESSNSNMDLGTGEADKENSLAKTVPTGSSDDGDLLLVLNEKAADIDATEYAKSVAEQAEEESEDAKVKDESLTCPESSKSPPSVNEQESEDKTDNSPDDLMDIGDSILDIGEASTTTVTDEVVEEAPLPTDQSAQEETSQKKNTEELETKEDDTEEKIDESINTGDEADEVGEPAVPNTTTISDNDSNKENVQDDEGTIESKPTGKSRESAPTGVGPKSLRKRISSDMYDSTDKTKKFKPNTTLTTDSSSVTPSIPLVLEIGTKIEMNDTDVKPKLEDDSKETFRALFKDISLKNINREGLEAFAVQKICESLVYKSEIRNLLKAIRDRDSIIDVMQKEISALSKQANDLNIVHEKILQDMQRFKRCSEKPLIVPRITRSVGLQAFLRETSTKKPVTVSPEPKPTPSLAKIAPRPPASNVVQLLKVAHQQLTGKSSLQMVAAPRPVQKSPKVSSTKCANNKVSQPAVSDNVATPSGASVIDLTSDDDKSLPASTTLQRLSLATKLIQPTNGHKFVLVNGQSVMVKIPPIAPGNNIALNNSPMKVITTGAPVRTMQTSILRTTNSVNSNTTPTNVVSAPVTTTPQRPSKAKFVKGRHPAPFPITPSRNIASNKPIPPRPQLTLTKTECGNGIILSWKITSNLELFSEIASYQIYAYHETKGEPRSENWSKIGDVKALQLPMAVTLTQFMAHNRYFFAVRAVDVLTRVGPFSEYQTI